MARLRWTLITFGLPALYVALLVIFNWPEKPEYVRATPTVMTVSEQAGASVLHMPEPIYPEQALRDSVEGTVKLHVSINADGLVTQATPVAGPPLLRAAAVDAVHRWQFEGKLAETQVDVGFSLRYVTRSLTPAEPVARSLPPNRSRQRGTVRVVALVDKDGHASMVQAVAGPEKLRAAAVESVRRWTFRPTLRNGLPIHATTVVEIPFS
ncbi:MAG: TonB family protein [Candidatus Solibacter sp.]